MTKIINSLAFRFKLRFSRYLLGFILGFINFNFNLFFLMLISNIYSSTNKRPADPEYNSFTQPPIMGGLSLKMIFWGCQSPTAFAGDYNTQIHREIEEMTGSIISLNLPENTTTITTTTIDKTNTTSGFDNKPTQNQTYFLFPFFFFNSNTCEMILANIGISQTDPFIFNLGLLYANICLIGFYFYTFIAYMGLCGIIYYIYNNKLNSLKSFIEKIKILEWSLFTVLTAAVIFRLNMFIRELLYNIYEIITFLNTRNLIELYNSSSLAMGKYRVLHIADYSWPLNYLNKIVDLNPDYILTYVTFIKYFLLFIIAVIIYMFIACITTAIYSQNNIHLSLPGKPDTLNLITKCFYLKKLYKSLFIILVIMFILIIIVAYLLFVYINIYVKG